MAIYFFDKNQILIKIAPDSATFEAIQTQELDDDSLLKDALSVTVKGDEKLLDAEYMAVKSYTGNAQTFDMYRIVTDSTPDKTMTFTGMSLAPYELNGHILKDLRPSNQSVEYTLNRILDGTDWRLGYIDDDLPNVTTTFYYVSAKEALKELQSLAGCEFVFKVEISGQKITDKWIEIYKEMGNRTKKRFNYGTNALTVVRETNKADIYTALIGRGKGEEVSSAEENESGQAGYGRKITFEDIEWSIAKGNPLDKPKGQYYLELPQATQVYGIKNIDGTMSARVGIVEFDDEEDKNRLINLTYQQLLVSSRPKVLFKTTVANIGATGIGDTVTIHRHDLGIHYQTRVRKIVRNKLNDNKTQVELGDAVVTASTKQSKKNNATIKNLNQELEKVKADVTTSQSSADGKNTIFYGSAEPERQRTGDTWYRPHPSLAGETQMLVWNGNAWELVVDSSDLTSVSREVEAAAKAADKAVQSAKDADTKANDALVKAGANANVLDTHQNTLNTINNTTIPAVRSSAQDALASAKNAMDEAKKADGKIADYVTTKGLVNGTTVDTKINDATGEISKKITTVESKIPTEIGGRNYYTRATTLSVLETVSSLTKAYDINGFKATGGSSGNKRFRMYNVIKSNGDWTISGYFRGTQNITVSFNVNLNDLVDSEWFTSTTDNTWKYFEFSGNVTNQSTTYNFINFHLGAWAHYEFKDIKVEKGSVPTDWSPAPEDNYTKEEFSIFESTYNEDVEGINSTLTSLSNSKLDGTTYTNFYNNEYKKTAQGVTDTYAKVNKIIDANGNSTDTFAKAVYDRNATRQSADFKSVTDGLVKTTTYNAGVQGINSSITTVQGNLDNLKMGSRNLLLESDKEVANNGYSIKSYRLSDISLIEKDGYYIITLIGELADGQTSWYLNLHQNINGTSAYPMMVTLEKGDKINNNTWSKRFKMPIGTNLTGVVGLYTLPLGNGKVAKVSKIKLSKGNVISEDWTPAPEDMATAIKTNEIERTADYSKLAITNLSENGVVESSSVNANKDGITERVAKVDANGNISYSNRDVKLNSIITSVADADYLSQQIQTSNLIQSTIKSKTDIVDLSGAKTFTNLTGYNSAVSNMAGYLIIRTPINSTNMVNIHIGGYNYLSNRSDIDINVSFYRYTATSFYNYTYSNKGNFNFGKVQVGTDSAGRAVIVLGSANTPYSYPKITVDKAIIGQGNVPDSYINGWSATISTSLTGIGSLTNIDGMEVQSQITQLADNINLKVSKSDLISQINVQAGGVLIQSGTNKLNVTPTTTYIENGTIKSAMIESLEADKIKTGTLDAAKVKVINLDANNITANKTEFIQSNWNDISSSIRIDAGGLLSTASDGSQVYLQNGVVGVRRPQTEGGGSIGQIGYVYDGGSPTYTIRTTWGSHFGLKQVFYDTYTQATNEKRVMYASTANDGVTTIQFYADGFILHQRKINFGFAHYINGADSNLSITGQKSITLRANESTIFIVSNDGTSNFATLHANLNMAGNTVTNTSDIRLKRDIVNDEIDSLSALMKWQHAGFNYINPDMNQDRQYGVIAQSAPDLSSIGEDGYLQVSLNKQVNMTSHALQQHVIKTNDKVEQLEAKIASLQEELATLKGD